jgi:hypothetical protein
MGQEKFSWLDQYAPKPAAPAPALVAPMPAPGQEEKKGKFSFLDEFAPGAAPAPAAPLPPYPKKEPSYGLPYIIKETVKGAIEDIKNLQPPSKYKAPESVLQPPPSEIQKVMNTLYSGGRGFVHTAVRDPLQFFLNSLIKGTAAAGPPELRALAGVAAAAKPELPAFPEAARITPLQDIAAGVGSFAGFIVGAPGKIGALTQGPIFQTVAKALAGKVPEKVAGIIAHLLAGSANLGVASVVAHPEVEGAFQRFTSGAVLGGIFGGTNLANFEKVAPFLNQMIRQVGSRAAAAVAGQYKPEFFNKIISGDITPDIAQDIFDELIFTWFSRRPVSAEQLGAEVAKVKQELKAANLKVYLGDEAEEALRWLGPMRETMTGLGKMAQGAGVSPAELLKPGNLGLLQQFLGVPDKAALEMRLSQMVPTSARAPEQVETFAEMPREAVPAAEVKPTTAKPAPAAAPAAPAPKPAAPAKPVLTYESTSPDFLRVERQALEAVSARMKGERPKYPNKSEIPIVPELEKAIAAGLPGIAKGEGIIPGTRTSYSIERPYGSMFIDSEGEIRVYPNKKGDKLGSAIEDIIKALGQPAAAEGAKGYVRTDQVLRDAITRVEKGEGSAEDVQALLSAAKRSERLKTLTEGYRGRLETDLLTGVGSDRALVKVKDHAERRQYWLDLKGVKEGNNDPERGYRWTDENIFKPTGDVLKSSGADAYRRGGGSDEFIILSNPGESAEQFQGRIADIERQLGEKKVEFRGVMAENMGEAERLMAQKKKGEPGGGVPPAAAAPPPPAGTPAPPAEARLRDIAERMTHLRGDRKKPSPGEMRELRDAGYAKEDEYHAFALTDKGRELAGLAPMPENVPQPSAPAPAAAGETTPAQQKGLKFPKPFKSHGFMTFNNINGKAWEQARELVKDGWVIEYNHNMGKDGIARIVDKRDPGEGDYYRAEGVPLRKYYESATSEFKGRAGRFGERVAERPLASLIKSRGGISWEKIKEAGLAGEFEGVLEGPNRDVITKRKGKGISPYEAVELAHQHERIATEDLPALLEELTGRGEGKLTTEEIEGRLAGEKKAEERELAVVQADLDALKSGKKKWEDLHDPQQEDLVAMFGEEGLKGLAPKEEVRRIMDRLEEEFEPTRPSREEEPEWFSEVEKAEAELKAEADKVAGDLKSGRRKWEDLTGHEQDDVIGVYGAEIQDKYRRQIQEPKKTSLEGMLKGLPEQVREFERKREAGDLSDIEEALIRGRELTKSQQERARKAGILEELPEKGEPAEPEIPKTPEEVLTKKTETPTGTMQLVNLAVRTPADTVFAFNNVPAKDLPKIREYARKLGVEDKLIVGDEHSGTWGEAYSPAEHLAHVREILRDVKKQPKNVWQSWERHVKIDTSGLEPDKGPPVGLSVQALSGFGPQVATGPGPKKPYMMSSAGRLYQNTIDRLHSLRKLGDFLRKDKIELHKENDPYIGARLYAGVQGKAELWLLQKRFKMVGGNRVYTGESLADILKPVTKDIENFSRYLVYRRVPELEARGIETGIDPAAARAFVHQHRAAFEGQAKKFTDYHNELMDLLVDAGRISKEKADIIKSMNPNYAAFQRVMDDVVKYGYVPTSAKFLAKIPNPIKQIRGSDRPIIDPIESAIKATYIIHNASERARINRQVIDLRDMSPEVAKLVKPTRPAMELVATLEDGTKVFRPKKNQPEGIIESWKDGERHYYEVPLDLYQTMSLLDNHSMSWLVKAMAIPARILRTGATTTPEFAFRNPFRDQWSGFVNTKYGYFPGIDFVRGLFHMLGKSDAYNSWKAGGGDWAMVTALDRATTKKRLQEVLGRRDYVLWLKNPVKFLERMSMYTEIPSRVGAFARAKGKAVTDIEAAFEAREATVDFARRGAKMKEISAIYTFFNARLQGMDRTARAFKERPFATTAKVFAVATLPSIINYFMNRDDPKFQEIPRWQRNLFWIINIKGHYIRIPKGDVGVLFGTPVEMILETLDRDPAHRPDLDKFAVDLFKEMMPISDWGGLFPVALRPLFENYVNFNFFKKRSIVPMGMERLEPEFQSFPYTTESAKALGQVLHYPPAKIENFIRGYGGGLGLHALRLLDTILEKTKQIPERPEKPKEPADIPGVGAFFVRKPEGFGSESAQLFYDTMKKLDQVKQTHGMLYKEKRKPELDAYAAKHPVEMKAIEGGFYSAFVKVRNELSEIREAQDRIYEDPKLEVNRKRLGLELLDRKIMILLVPLLNRYAALGEKYGKIKQ